MFIIPVDHTASQSFLIRPICFIESTAVMLV